MNHRVLTLGGSLAIAAALALPAPTTASPLFGDTRVRPTLAGGSISPISSGPRHAFPSVARGLARIGARYVGPASLGNALITFHVQTAMRNEAALHAYARAANTPGSVYYRHWLTPGAIANAFGTPVASYNAAADYFRSFGMAVHPWAMRTALTVTGRQPQVEAALGTKLGVFALRNARFYYPARALSLPSAVAVANISPISNISRLHTTSMPGGPPEPISGGFNNSRVNGVTIPQLAEAYDLNTAYAKGYTGSGINLGIIGTGPIAAADFTNFRSLFGIKGTSTITQTNVSLNGDTTPPPVTGPCTAGTSTAPVAGCNPEDEEAQLDTEQTAGIARDANVLFYLAYNGSGCTVASAAGMCVGGTSASQGLGLADDELMQAVADNKADILSLSYGGCETYEIALAVLTPTPGGDATGTDPTIFSELASEGVATFVSSGDSGSAGCQRLAGFTDAPSASYPSTDPNVVSVGGTTTPIAPNGRLNGPITNWGQQTKSGGAAGAGMSTLFTTPTFQTNAPAAAAICTMRCQPDVALNADPFTGQAVVYNTGLSGGAMESPIGGTSASAPDMAGMWAVVLSACKVTTSCQGPKNPVTDPVTGAKGPSVNYRLGNPNYLWYPMLATNTYHQVFYDITYGNDGVPSYAAQTAAGEAGTDAYVAGIVPGSVSAGTGFDQASGLGFPFGYALLKAIVPGAN